MTETDPQTDTCNRRPVPPVIRFRVSESDRDQIKQRAAAAGLSISAYVRHMALSGRVTVQNRQTGDQPETARQLLKIGNNLNQIARGGNQLGVVDRQELHDLVSQIRAAVEFVTRD